ncbi:CRISPR-associated endonuclease Cas2 [Alkanindiges illinoisensis]|uniref:CRISPR-associated endonuclease Cas2 n=1 Tax=Alkanindiges illinoisensis TaxID=197183 RepID=UPI0004789030|nr:CRISPR-associated endonuclease Cas2 [Alkanindiges illinoisensis]
MAAYLVSYDLIKDKDYSELIDAIKAYPNWAKPLKSVFIIISQTTASQIRDNLKTHIDADDEILVVKLSTDASNWATYGISKEVTDWMKSNL